MLKQDFCKWLIISAKLLLIVLVREALNSVLEPMAAVCLSVCLSVCHII